VSGVGKIASRGAAKRHSISGAPSSSLHGRRQQERGGITEASNLVRSRETGWVEGERLYLSDQLEYSHSDQ